MRHTKHGGMGWLPDRPDQRDHVYAAPASVLSALPTTIDLRSKLPAAYDQGNLGSCHDDQTDVLTDTGWKRFADLDGSERLASVDPDTARLIFEVPTRLVRFPYDGQMHRCVNQFQKFRVTPDHRMLVRPWDEAERRLSSGYVLTPAENIGWYCGLMNRVFWNGDSTSETFTLPGVAHKHIPQRSPRDVPMRSWMQFLGIFCAEGTMLSSQPWKARYKVQIAATKEREKQFIRGVFADLGIRALELGDRFTFENRQIFEAMVGLGLWGKKAGDKFVPSFVFRQSAAMIRQFLAGHFAGDGSEQYGIRSHYSSSHKLADDLQALAFMSGQESRLSIREARSSVMADGRAVIGVLPEHRVSVCERKNQSIERKRQIVVENYNGEVFCAEVPTYHTLVTRREGTVLISGNCTANAIAGAVEYDWRQQKLTDAVPSRLFIYYQERLIENTIAIDSGAYIRDGLKAIAKYGAPHESLWPYDITKFTKKPPTKAYADGLLRQAVSYARVTQTLQQLQGCLAAGFPFVFGFTVYESFESDKVANTGMVPMPASHETELGGHAVLCIGYRDSDRRFIVRNSWGDWGSSGNCFMPYEYLTSSGLASDFWKVTLMEADPT